MLRPPRCGAQGKWQCHPCATAPHAQGPLHEHGSAPTCLQHWRRTRGDEAGSSAPEGACRLPQPTGSIGKHHRARFRAPHPRHAWGARRPAAVSGTCRPERTRACHRPRAARPRPRRAAAPPSCACPPGRATVGLLRRRERRRLPSRPSRHFQSAGRSSRGSGPARRPRWRMLRSRRDALPRATRRPTQGQRPCAHLLARPPPPSAPPATRAPPRPPEPSPQRGRRS